MFRWVTLASKPLVVLSVGMTVASGTMALSSIVSLDFGLMCSFSSLLHFACPQLRVAMVILLIL